MRTSNNQSKKFTIKHYTFFSPDCNSQVFCCRCSHCANLDFAQWLFMNNVINIEKEIINCGGKHG